MKVVFDNRVSVAVLDRSNRSFWDLKGKTTEEVRKLQQAGFKPFLLGFESGYGVYAARGRLWFKPFLLGFESIRSSVDELRGRFAFKPFLLGFETYAVQVSPSSFEIQFKPFLLGFETRPRRGAQCGRDFGSNRSFWDLKLLGGDGGRSSLCGVQTVPSGI